MVIGKFMAMAYRSVLRNARRSALTALAVALGLVVVMILSGMIEGMVANALADNIRISTGHLQVRNANYDVEKGSLLAQDLLQDPQELAAQAETLPGVRSASPVLWHSGLLSTPRESIGIQIVGIDPADGFHAPIREGIAAGTYLQPDERGQILIGKVLADQMGIAVGQRVSLAASNADGEGREGTFTVAGLVDTGFPGIDQNRVIMTLDQAQSFSGTGDRASSLILLLDDQEQAQTTAALFSSGQLATFTWQDLNSVLLQSVETGVVFYYIVYVIVFLAVAVIIANTLLMSVFERTREFGVLASLGMNGGQIMVLVLFEAIILAVFGVAVGLVLGMGAVTYMAVIGISFSVETATMIEGMAIGTTMKGGYAPEQFAILSLLCLLIVSVVALYPAWYAARLEPVEALHAL